MKINGINRTVTSSTQIQILGRCDTVGGMTCDVHEGGEGILGSECSVFSFKGSGPSRTGKQTFYPGKSDLIRSKKFKNYESRSQASEFRAKRRSPMFTEIHPYSPIFTGFGQKNKKIVVRTWLAICGRHMQGNTSKCLLRRSVPDGPMGSRGWEPAEARRN